MKLQSGDVGSLATLHTPVWMYFVVARFTIRYDTASKLHPIVEEFAELKTWEWQYSTHVPSVSYVNAVKAYI